ncbi:MAG: hypothetical protein E7Z64_00905 [Thermoplasmata archaeon]|jgi:ABC-type nitrate/sulfonate/bicarbonate transport system substrate-binding protein|nr:hypothetical protein [Thermoplasmata archaeon]
MDKKILIAIVAVVVVAAAVVTVFAMNNDDDDSSGSGADYVSLGLTNNFFPEHTCCVVAANYNYIHNNPIGVEKFLAGYYDSVQYINGVLADPDSQEYADLVSFTKSKVPGLTDKEVKDALGTITYLYADSSDGSLSTLKNDMKTLIADLNSVGALKKEVSNVDGFVNNYVDDTYLTTAISNKESLKGGSNSVTVAVISGDIHQIAIHVGIDKGFFREYGTSVTISNATNGGGIATSLINGDSSIGFLGAPPATINMINQGYITSDEVKDKAFNLVARVNSEGSGLFIKSSVLDDSDSDVPMRKGVAFYSVSDGRFTVSSENAAAWGGLIFSTPGTTSIQHIQLMTLAKNLGLKTQAYLAGESTSNDTIYYVTNLANYQQIVADPSINAGIIWEPQYQRVIQES